MEYGITKILGETPNAIVLPGMLTKEDGTQETVAIKYVTTSSWKEAIALEKEIEILSMLNNENIIEFFGGETIAKKHGLRDMHMICVVMQKMEMSLTQYFTGLEAPGRNITFKQFLKIFKQVAQGLVYLHRAQPDKKSVIHHDLKPANILINMDRGVRLTDFGLSRILDSGRRSITATLQGTPRYWAPELLIQSPSPMMEERDKARKITPSVDIYSYGKTLTVCINLLQNPTWGLPGQSPEYSNESPKDDLSPGAVPEALHKLIQDCVRFDKSHLDTGEYGRPTPEEIVNRIDRMLTEASMDEMVVDYPQVRS